MVSLSEIKKHNKSVGGHFFDKGLPPVVQVIGNYLITQHEDIRGNPEGFNIYEYNPSTGRIQFLDNKDGEYSAEPHKSKADAIAYIKRLGK